MAMTRAGVRKWKNFEREVARVLRALAPGARRCLQYQKKHGAPDVEAGVLWVEAKSGEHKPVEQVFRETAAKARRGAVPAVVTRAAGKRGPKLITLSLSDFVRIASATPALRRALWKGARR